MRVRHHIAESVILETYCALRQLERGIDAALSESWNDFIDYYATNHKSQIESLSLVFRTAFYEKKKSLDLKKEGFLKFLTNSFKISVTKQLACEIIFFFDEFDKVAASKVNIDDGIKIALRKKASELRSILESQYKRIKGMVEANSVDHYFRSSKIKTYSLDQIRKINRGETE